MNGFLPLMMPVILVVALSGTTAWAQVPPAVAGPFSPNALERVVRDSQQSDSRMRQSRTTSSPTVRKDSILDGGLIGAAIGGVGGSFLLVVASGGSDDFGGAMLKVSPLTAAIGFGIGAAIDAFR